MKKILPVIIALSLTIILISCSVLSDNPKEIIRINGDVSIEIEVGNEYIELGVLVPKNYVYEITGNLDTNIVGDYQLKYTVLSDDGEMAKELYRYVHVIDSEPPTYELVNSANYYVGFTYSIDDFILDFGDNYYNMDQLILTSNIDSALNIKEAGVYNISFSIKDGSDNITSAEFNVELILDFEKLIDEVYKNQPSKVTKTVTGVGSRMINVTIDSNSSFSYFDTGSLHYLKRVSTKLGTYASIQISAKYNEFNSASLNYHISGSESSYSVGFITFDATKQYDSLTFTSFNSIINNLNLNQQDMLNEMNSSVLEVLDEFIDYFEEVLNITFK